MKHNVAIAFLGICFVVGGFVRAEAQGGANPKIGFMDLQRTLSETKVGKGAKRRLEATKKKKQNELNRKQKSLQSAASELEKQRMMLKPAVLQKRERALQEKYVKLQETYMTLQQSLVAQEAELVKEIFGKAAPVIKKVAKQKGFTVILDKTAILWADSKFDITKSVNGQLNK
ncbi:MAG: OmpH family outer membrane protein [Kofleriaceae bacterium]|nr:OmpH family outer membrane protein [Kofleriaceae bacterium]